MESDKNQLGDLVAVNVGVLRLPTLESDKFHCNSRVEPLKWDWTRINLGSDENRVGDLGADESPLLNYPL